VSFGRIDRPRGLLLEVVREALELDQAIGATGPTECLGRELGMTSRPV